MGCAAACAEPTRTLGRRCSRLFGCATCCGGDDAAPSALQAAGPPAEVLRAAQREYRRLRRGSEQHPGHAAGLAYLETLATLPWTRTSRDADAPGGRGQAVEDVQGAGTAALDPGQQQQAQQAQVKQEQQQAQQQQVLVPAGSSEPSLGAVRAALDEAHYGLEKVKERIVEVGQGQGRGGMRCGGGGGGGRLGWHAAGPESAASCLALAGTSRVLPLDAGQPSVQLHFLELAPPPHPTLTATHPLTHPQHSLWPSSGCGAGTRVRPSSALWAHRAWARQAWRSQ